MDLLNGIELRESIKNRISKEFLISLLNSDGSDIVSGGYARLYLLK